jgi:hypothetical protein
MCHALHTPLTVREICEDAGSRTQHDAMSEASDIAWRADHERHSRTLRAAPLNVSHSLSSFFASMPQDILSFATATRRLARPWRAGVAALAASCALNGCAWTLITAADATGSVIQAGYAVASNYSSPKFFTGEPANVRSICIELNPMVTASDFLPSLQLALEGRGVHSDLYSPGTEPIGCEARLVYNASVEFGKPTFSDENRAYLSTINIAIFEHNRIVATAHYEVHGLGTDRYSSAAVKLKGMVDEMVVDQRKLGGMFESASNGPNGQ